MKTFNSLEDAAENIKIGDIVTFNKRNSFFKITGEVTGCYFFNDKFYLKIYSLFNRRLGTYILTRDLELKPARKKNPAHLELVNDYSDPSGKHPAFLWLKRAVIKTVSIILVLTFLVYNYPNLLNLVYYPAISYDEFLSKNYTINELFQTVNSRITYRPEIGDTWDMPRTAWYKRYGDCEEFAFICSDYLNHHKIESYVVGMETKDPNTGHAVVFLRLKNVYYIIDPTRAIEAAGVKRLENCLTLKDAVKLYARSPAEVFKIPEHENEKTLLSVIY